jgi:hypothetical protein
MVRSAAAPRVSNHEAVIYVVMSGMRAQIMENAHAD